MAVNSLKKHNLFKNLPEDSFSLLTRKLKESEYDMGQFLFHEGAYPVGIYVLSEGLVKLYKTGHTGKQQIFRFCKAGDIFGFHPIFTEDEYPDSAETISDCTIGFIPRDDFYSIIETSHPVCLRLLNLLCDEFRDFIDQETMLAQKSVRERVAACFLRLKHVFWMEQEQATIINLSRSDLADYVGTTVESLVRVMHEYKNDGLISVDGRLIQIENETDLKKMANI